LKFIPVHRFYDEFLKSFQTDFAPIDESGEPSAVQAIIDENLINGMIGMFLKYDTTISLRQLLSIDPRLQMIA